jgi:hypothetical protein
MAGAIGRIDVIEADKAKFCKTLLGLALVKPPHAKLAPEAYEIWWQALQDWPLDEFQQAAAHLSKSVEFMPSPFHFEQLRKAGRPTAGEAWAHIRAMARQSFEGEPADPIAARALQALGGLRSVAMCDSDKVHFLERRFAEHYEAMQDSEEVRQALPQIAEDRRIGVSAVAKQLARMKQ